MRAALDGTVVPRNFGSLGVVLATEAADIWSLGVLMWQLLAQHPLYSSESEAVAALGSGGPSMGCVSDLQARHLLQKMLVRAPQERLPADRVLKHGYLTHGLDTVQMAATFGPMQKGQLFVRSLLNQLSQALGDSG